MTWRKTVGRRALVRLGGVLGVAGAGAALSRPARQGLSAAGILEGSEIVGTWVIDAPGAPSTRLLQTYNADGTHLSLHDEHTTRSPQLGAWTRIGDRQFLMRNISYRFAGDGRRSGEIDVRAVYTVDPDGQTMSGRGIRFETDVDGNLITPIIPWTSRARRLELVPID